MNVMSAFVGIDGFEIHDVSDNVVFILDAIACNEANIKLCFYQYQGFLVQNVQRTAKHIATVPGNFQCLATIVTFQNGNHFWSPQTFILEST